MSQQPPYIVLPPQVRGDEFRYSSTLVNGWQNSMITGGWRWVLRRSWPASSVTTDADAVEVATSGAEIVFSSETAFQILIPGARTTLWPGAKRLFWDFQGVITTGARVLTFARGEILITPDAGRATS